MLSIGIEFRDNATSCSSHRHYVNTGDFQLPLYQGSVPREALAAPDIQVFIADQIKSHKTKSKGMKGIKLSDGG